MKLDQKKRKVQAKYRRQVNRSSNAKQSTLELLIIVMIIIILFLLNAYFKGF